LNDKNLRLIQVCVVTVSALATGYVNAFAHQERLGRAGAGVLALLIMGFVEKFYFTLRHGLATTYKSGRQRLVATLCYRTIQATMILNAAVLCRDARVPIVLVSMVHRRPFRPGAPGRLGRARL
jgi:hypothetical protein